MVNRNIADDLFIHGKGGTSAPSIKTPARNQLTLEGTVNIVDRTGITVIPDTNDAGRLFINGKKVLDNRKVTTVNGSGTVTYNILSTDDYIRIKLDHSVATKVTLNFPPIVSVGSIYYTIEMVVTTPGANASKVIFAAYGDSSDATAFLIQDRMDGMSEVKYNTYRSFIVVDKPGSMTLRSAEGIYPDRSTNGWIIENSNNLAQKEHIYLSPVQVASTANIPDLSLIIPGVVMDGYTLVENDRVLLKNQTTPSENGVYSVQANGLFRTHDVPTGSFAYTHLIHTNTGTANANNTYRMYATVPNSLVGTDSLTYVNVAPQGAATQVQYVDSTGYGFSSDANFTWDGTNLDIGAGAPTAGTHAANKTYVDSLAGAGVSWKDSVRAATAAPGTLATDFENGDTIDTAVVLATGDRILIKDQASGVENGIYIVQASGAPVRASDLPAGSSAAGAAVFVEEGTANADTQWVCTDDGGSDVVNTDALTFVQFGATVSPAGANTEIQFNNAGAFGASSSLAWDGTSVVVNSIAGSAVTSNPSVYDNITTGEIGIGGGLTSGNIRLGVTSSTGDLIIDQPETIWFAPTLLASNVASNVSLFGSTTTGNISLGAALTTGDIEIGNASAGQQVSFNGTDDSTSASTGSVVFDGGVGIAKELYLGGDIHLLNNKAVKMGAGANFNLNYDGANSYITGPILSLRSSSGNMVFTNTSVSNDFIFGSTTTTGNFTIGSALTTGDINLGVSSQTGDVDVKSALVLSNKTTVTQATDINTGVTADTCAGVITTVSATIASHAKESFTVTCARCLATSVISLTTEYAGTGGVYAMATPGAGSFVITLVNGSGSSLDDVVKIHYVIF